MGEPGITTAALRCLLVLGFLAGTLAGCRSAQDTAPSKVDTANLLTLQRIHKGEPLWGRSPRGASFSPDGTWLAFLRGGEDARKLDLWGMRLDDTDPSPKLLVAASDLADASHEMSEEERMARERKRISTQGISSYEWCGRQGKLLFPLAGQLYIYDLEATSAPVTTVTTETGSYLDARCSPHGNFVSWVEEGNVYVADAAGTGSRAITSGASDVRKFGVAEFIAQEEMGRYDGHWWSPDEKFLAYTEVDESPVGVKVRPLIHADSTELFSQRYPAAGEANAVVHLHVREHSTGNTLTVPLPTEDGYLARVTWHKSSLYIQWQSRDQRLLTLSRAQPPEFIPQVLLTERDDAWVELHNDLTFLPDGRFLWPSEKSGVRQLYLHTADGAVIHQLTQGDEPVMGVSGVHDGHVYFVRGVDRGLQRHLFRTTLDTPTPAQRVTDAPGWHSIRMARRGTGFLDYHSATFNPTTVTLRNLAGKAIFTLDDNPAPTWRALPKPTVHFVEIPASDGTILNGRLVEPQGRVEGQRYPVIVSTYAGPTGQIVKDGFARGDAFTIYLTQRGFGVFSLDNRGVRGRDRAFARALHNRFGVTEIEDQITGARWLQTQEWVDPGRIGVWGWSYGGYASALLILADETPFACAVAIAPVTDWRIYDTHYTERYLGTPQDNPEAYERSSVLAKAKNLDKPLLIIHGMADDNVLFEHSLKLITALQRESIPFALMVYPGKAHGINGSGTRLHVFRTLTSFFQHHLRPATGGGTRLSPE
jgi:dipeptidyl-peptidase-4